MKNIKTWLLTGLLIFAAGAGIVTAPLKSVRADGYDRRQAVAEEALNGGASAAGISAYGAVSSRAWRRINGVCYNGSGVAIPGAITRGIDVSEWQENIDWNKVKKSDVDFAFVRIAYGTGHLDKTYKANMLKAEKAGMPVGTYVYSLAATTEQALAEAKLAVSQMKGCKVSYPVVYDLEYAEMGNLPKEQISRLALAFCNEVSKAGYHPMVYCNTYWYDNKVDWSQLSGLDVWLACYGDKISAPSQSLYRYGIWQATDGDGGGVLNPTKGLVAGIPSSSNVDIDFGFVDYTKKITPRSYPVSTYVPSSKPSVDDVAGVNPGKNGWMDENGRTYYYKNDKKLTGWQKIGGKYYYLNSSKGYLYRNRLLVSTKKNICYVDASGARVSGRWVTENGKKYYMSSNGYALKGVKKVGTGTYYFHKTNAYMFTRKVVSTSKGMYYFGSNGARYKSQFRTISNKTYFFKSNGVAAKSWLKIDGKWYYFSPKTGAMYKSRKITNSRGRVYSFNSKGVCTNRK